MPIKTNIAFDLGETWVINHTACAADGVTPRDLTGAAVAFQMRNSGGVLIAPGQTSVSIAAPTSGQSVITIPTSAQAGLTPGSYSYGIRVTLAGGSITDQNSGSLTVNASANNT